MDHERKSASQPIRFPSKFALLVVVVAAGANSGCEMPAIPDLPALPGVYRIDIQQGNIVEREMVDQLEIGMEQSKVRFILGTPLLVDPFNLDRWDYIYSLHRGSGEAVSQRVSLYFVDSRLARIEKRLAPRAVADAAAEREQKLVKVPKRRPREGIFQRLTPDFLKRDDDPPADSAGAGEEPATE